MHDKTQPFFATTNNNDVTQPGFMDSGNFNNSGHGDSTMPDVEIGNATGKTSDPLAGFLVSYSKTLIGEYWPLYIGNNPIGTSAECKVKLNEKMISGMHGNISIRPDHQNNCLHIQYIDRESKNGSYINGNQILDVGIGNKIKHGDKIKVGGYEFFLVIVDRYILSLDINPEFKAKGNSMDVADMHNYQNFDANSDRTLPNT
jgi:hypothetical protein